MSQALRDVWGLGLYVLQRIAFVSFGVAALALVVYTLACAFGVATWLNMDLTFGTTVYQDAGIFVQLGLTGLFVLLCAFLPSNARIMALENSHRSFHMGMRDVTRAYHAAHRADREGAFTLASEFDSVRERIAFLRDHPDLSELEPSVLELASQMSHISRELADMYSDAKVARAQDFLVQRQQEIEDFNQQLDNAKAIAAEMRKWINRVEIEEDIARSQMARLLEELDDVMPYLDPPNTPSQSELAQEGIVLPINAKAAE